MQGLFGKVILLRLTCRTAVAQLFHFPRVELGVGFFEVGDGQAQVAFGGGQGAVAEQILDVPQVGVVLHKVSRAGVAPNMRGAATGLSWRRRA